MWIFLVGEGYNFYGEILYLQSFSAKAQNKNHGEVGEWLKPAVC